MPGCHLPPLGVLLLFGSIVIFATVQPEVEPIDGSRLSCDALSGVLNSVASALHIRNDIELGRLLQPAKPTEHLPRLQNRSEERRVGKECSMRRDPLCE